MRFFFGFIFFIFTFFPLSAAFAHQALPKLSGKQIQTLLNNYALQIFTTHKDQAQSRIRVIDVKINNTTSTIDVVFNAHITHLPIREELVLQWRGDIQHILVEKYGSVLKSAHIRLFSSGRELEEYIPNIYRVNLPVDSSRYAVRGSSGVPFLRKKSVEIPTQGLYLRHIALWPSHGIYYETRDTIPSWKFQRPALFTTIEDLHSYEYVAHYLAPMLENAGAQLFIPRERCVNPVEVIVDSDSSSFGSSVRVVRGMWRKGEGGYKHIDTLLSQNPHQNGNYIYSTKDAVVQFCGLIPVSGRYGVTISYPSFPTNQTAVLVRVRHSAGVAEFELNQQLMGSTWVYLGEWDFLQGEAVVEFVGEGSGGTVVADVVRFGGGNGSVRRGESTSGMPRWVEASRYYLQYCGVPDSIYKIGEYERLKTPDYNPKDPTEQDYVDDFKCRGEWVNWLTESKGVEIDLALSLHTNAGIVDTIFGSLAIHTTEFEDIDTLLRDGSSRLTCRDLSDIILTQVVEGIQREIEPRWTRRTNYNKPYSEAMRPKVPSMLLEMFSHQNKADMDLALTQKFRFHMARNIYIGILKYLSERDNTTYTVQPLPPINLRIANNTIHWTQNVDKVEPSAIPTQYIVYGSPNSVDFYEIGRTTTTELKIPGNWSEKFYVVAQNSGGNSLRSKMINVSGQIQDTYIDLSYTGEVYDFNPESEFESNQKPGFGASSTEFSGKGMVRDVEKN